MEFNWEGSAITDDASLAMSPHLYRRQPQRDAGGRQRREWSDVTMSHFAVVRADGSLARGNIGTTSTHTATVRFTVRHNRGLLGCGTVVTRGSVDSLVPFSPATVEAATPPNGQSIAIQVRSLLFFGGALADESFHTATLCRT